MTTQASYRKVSEGVISEHATYIKVSSHLKAVVLGPGQAAKPLLNPAQVALEGLLAEGMNAAGYCRTDKAK